MTYDGSFVEFTSECQDIYLYMKNKSPDSIHNLGLCYSLILIFAAEAKLEKDELKEYLEDILKTFCQNS